MGSEMCIRDRSTGGAHRDQGESTGGAHRDQGESTGEAHRDQGVNRRGMFFTLNSGLGLYRETLQRGSTVAIGTVVHLCPSWTGQTTVYVPFPSMFYF